MSVLFLISAKYFESTSSNSFEVQEQFCALYPILVRTQYAAALHLSLDLDIEDSPKF